MTDGPRTFVAADALMIRVRGGGRVVKVAIMVATGVNAEGYREILGSHRHNPRPMVSMTTAALPQNQSGDCAPASYKQTMNRHLRPPLIVTGGPAAGKTTTGCILAESLPHAAFIDTDDIRQLIVRGAAAPWEGAAGEQQVDLAARNVAGLTRNFHDNGFDVVIADVLDSRTATTYRRLLPAVLMVHLVVSLDEAQRRAAKREVWLTDEEFAWLHRRDQTHPPAVDVRLDVEALDLPSQVAAVEDAWLSAASSLHGRSTS